MIKFLIYILLTAIPARAEIPGPCGVKLIAGDGGALHFYLGNLHLEDVQSVVNIEGLAFYSISPIYGKPELGVIDCKDKTLKTIVAAKNKTSDPNGSDLFLLKDIKKIDGKRFRISYYYAPDANATTLSKVRSKKNLKSVLYSK